jgi:hypothetical protein
MMKTKLTSAEYQQLPVQLKNRYARYSGSDEVHYELVTSQPPPVTDEHLAILDKNYSLREAIIRKHVRNIPRPSMLSEGFNHLYENSVANDKVVHAAMEEYAKRNAQISPVNPEVQAKPTDKYKFCNHHHELTEKEQLVNYGDGDFVANKQALPLLDALHQLRLRTRTHHVGDKECFVSILIDDNVTADVREIYERDADRTRYNGMFEVLISWTRG